ncbi:MAG TPA: hypothetical protein VLE47_00900 [Candidatus Saccharimonadales bacterium]|nr:hypothetical protein [Candidatus Saccharimonadales bacterium]
MDLIALFKKSVRDPLHFNSFFIIFVTLFIFLIIGISIVALSSNLLSSQTGCNATKTKQLSGIASKTSDTVYLLKFDGNSQCFLSGSVTWANKNSSIKIWLYDPSGKVSIISPNPNQTYSLIYAASPVSQGTWKMVLKADSKEVPFSGEVSIK